MVKSYLRYEQAEVFGVIASGESNISFDNSGKFLMCPALDKLGVWHVRQGVCSKTLSPSSSSSSGPSLGITAIASSPSSLVGVGYADGSIRLWDLDKGTCETTLNGHNGAVTVLVFNKIGSVLASGSKENDIILWDVVAETGLYRLRGHRDQVTDLLFLDSGKKLVSSSKDKFLRVWDLETQYCMQIVSGHHSEIWSIACDPEEKFLVTGSADPELRFYTIVKPDEEGGPSQDTSNPGESVNKWEVLKPFGEVQRQTKDRVATLRFNKSGNLLACHVAGKLVEIFRVLDEAESKRKAKRRINRKKEKKEKKKGSELADDGDHNNGTQEEGNPSGVIVTDIFKLFQTLRAGKKICSISFCPTHPKSSLATLALSLNNNSVEIYSVEKDSNRQTQSIELAGHRSVVRSLCLSPDNSLLLSTTHNAVKIWNPSTGNSLRTIDSEYGLCSMFVPVKSSNKSASNKYALVGTKAGNVEIIDIASATCVEVVEAHGGDIRSISAIPDESGLAGFVTGSTDRDVKFWEYRKQKSGEAMERLTVSNVRTMTMSDEVVKIVISPDAKYIAVALQDSNVKVFYLDSLKQHVILYGHKLPVLCMDVSSDGDLIVTGSSDKNLKIWGLDFGDCHKSLFAHAASVMDVKFVPNTHYVFSVGNDQLLKFWDADKFELLLTLEGHHAEIWCLAISSRGDFVVTGSQDKSIRRWDRTDEPFFIEEEKEKRIEEMFEADADGAFENKYDPKEELPEEGAVGAAGKKTQETLTATDLIIDALDMAEAETLRMTEHEEESRRGKVSKFVPNMLMLGHSPSDYVLHSLSKVQTSDLEQSLLALPFSDSLKLLSYLKYWTINIEKIELIFKVATIIVQTHHHQLTSTPSARPLLSVLKDLQHAKAKECKDTIGFNLAVMNYISNLLAMKNDAPFHDAKSKLLEVRSKRAKLDSTKAEEARGQRKTKKRKTAGSDGHAWTVIR